MVMDVEQKKSVMEEHARTPGDTGSAEVQIALLTARILSLTDHFKATPKTSTRAQGCCAWWGSGAIC